MVRPYYGFCVNKYSISQIELIKKQFEGKIAVITAWSPQQFVEQDVRFCKRSTKAAAKTVRFCKRSTKAAAKTVPVFRVIFQMFQILVVHHVESTERTNRPTVRQYRPVALKVLLLTLQDQARTMRTD
jgi:hypothetical protein